MRLHDETDDNAIEMAEPVEIGEVRVSTDGAVEVPMGVTELQVKFILANGVSTTLGVQSTESIEQVLSRLSVRDGFLQVHSYGAVFDRSYMDTTRVGDTVDDWGLFDGCTVYLVEKTADFIPGNSIGSNIILPQDTYHDDPNVHTPQDDSSSSNAQSQSQFPRMQELPGPLTFTEISLLLIIFTTIVLYNYMQGIMGLPLSAMILLPTMLLLCWWRKNRDVTQIRKVVLEYSKGFFCIVPVFFVQCILLVIVVELTPLRTGGMFGWVLFTVLVSYLVVAIPEEAIKFVWSSQILSGNPQDRLTGDLIYATSSSLGFATGQSFLYTFGTVTNAHSFGDIAFIVSCVLVVFLLPLHVLTGYQIGLKLTILDYFLSHPNDDRYRPGVFDRSMNGILAVPILLRGTLFGSCVILVIVDAKINVVIGVLCGVSVMLCIMCVAYTKYVERRLPAEYLRRVGYLHVMGYGVLPDGPG